MHECTTMKLKMLKHEGPLATQCILKVRSGELRLDAPHP